MLLPGAVDSGYGCEAADDGSCGTVMVVAPNAVVVPTRLALLTMCCEEPA